jgi:hypothetical protein
VISGGYTGQKDTVDGSSSILPPDPASSIGRIFVISGNITVHLKRLNFLNASVASDSYQDTYHGYGAALYLDGASVFLHQVRFSNNRAVRGGAVYLGANASLQTYETDTEKADILASFEADTAHFGGAIYADVNAKGFDLYKAHFSKNTALQHGGAIELHGGESVLHQSLFTENFASLRGGAIYLSGHADTLSSLIINDSSLFRNNRVGGVLDASIPFAHGGALYAGVAGESLPQVGNIHLNLGRASFLYNTASVISPLNAKTHLDLSKGGALFIEPGVHLNFSNPDSLLLLNNYVTQDDTFAFDLANNVYPPAQHTWQIAFSTHNVPGQLPQRTQAYLYDIPRVQPPSSLTLPSSLLDSSGRVEYTFDKLIVTTHLLPLSVDTLTPTADSFKLSPPAHLSITLPPSLFRPFVGNYIYVAPQADDTHNGASWNDALSLTKAIQLARNGDTLLLKVGTYLFPNPDEQQIPDIAAFSIINKSLTLRGSFSGFGADRFTYSPASSAWHASASIIDGERKYRALHIATENTFSPNTVTLDGISLFNGFLPLNGLNEDRQGGANLLIDKSHVTLLNCRVSKGSVSFDRPKKPHTLLPGQNWRPMIVSIPCGGGISVTNAAKLILGAVTICDNTITEVDNSSYFDSIPFWHQWGVTEGTEAWWWNYGPAIYLQGKASTLELLQPLDLNIYNNEHRAQYQFSYGPYDYSRNIDHLFRERSSISAWGDTLFYLVDLKAVSTYPPLVHGDTVKEGYYTSHRRLYSVPIGTPFHFQPIFPNGILIHPRRLFPDPCFHHAVSYSANPDSLGAFMIVPHLKDTTVITFLPTDHFNTPRRLYALPKDATIPANPSPDHPLPQWNYLFYADGLRPALALPPDTLFKPSGNNNKRRSGDTILFAPMTYPCAATAFSQQDAVTLLGNAFRLPSSLWPPNNQKDPHGDTTFITPTLQDSLPIFDIQGTFNAFKLTFKGARVRSSLPRLSPMLTGGGALFIDQNAKVTLDSVSFVDNIALDLTKITTPPPPLFPLSSPRRCYLSPAWRLSPTQRRLLYQ